MQNQPISRSLLSDQIQAKAIKSKLQLDTLALFNKICNAELALKNMSIDQLKYYETGLSLYLKSETLHLQNVINEIKRKQDEEDNDREVRKILYKSINEWQAIGLILILWLTITTAIVYIVFELQQMQTIWLKWLLGILAEILGFALFLASSKWIWIRRDITEVYEMLDESDQYQSH